MTVRTVEGGWCLEGDTLRPTYDYIQRVTSWLGDQEDDFVFRFAFHPSFEAPSVRVHQSRLTWAGGPLKAIVSGGFAEQESRQVQLCQEDDPETFSVIKDFLYLKVIDFGVRSTEQLIKIVLSSHRWELLGLCESACTYFTEGTLLLGADRVLAARRIASLPGIPEHFNIYFWDCVTRCFDDFAEERETGCPDTDPEDIEKKSAGHSNTNVAISSKSSGGVESRLCPGFPDLWPLALSQSQQTVESVLGGILRYSKQDVTQGLLEVILRYMQPRIQSDAVVFRLLEKLKLKSRDFDRLLSSINNYHYNYEKEELSFRAMRILALCLLREIKPPEMSDLGARRVQYSWQHRVEDLLKDVCHDVVFTPEGMGRVMQEKELFRGATPFLHDISITFRVRNWIGCDDHGMDVSELCVDWRNAHAFECCNLDWSVDLTIQVSERKCSFGVPYVSGKKCIVKESYRYTITNESHFKATIAHEFLEEFRDKHGAHPNCGVIVTLIIFTGDE